MDRLLWVTNISVVIGTAIYCIALFKIFRKIFIDPQDAYTPKYKWIKEKRLANVGTLFILVGIVWFMIVVYILS